MYVYMHMHVCTYVWICEYMSPHSILKWNWVDVLQILMLWPTFSMDACILLILEKVTFVAGQRNYYCFLHRGQNGAIYELIVQNQQL